MKKYVLSLLLLLASASLSALPLGNPWEASLMCDGVFCERYCGDPCNLNWCNGWSIRLGFYGDYVYDRHMKIAHTGATIHRTELYTNAGFLALNFFNRVDLFTTLGASQIKFTATRNEFDETPVNTDEWLRYETATDFSWSIGLRGTIWECNCFAVGGEFQYFQTRPDLNFIRDDNDRPNYFPGESVKYMEWQFGLGAAYRINIIACSSALVPYAGLKWGNAQLNSNNVRFRNSSNDNVPIRLLKKDRNWGYAIGLTLLGCNKWTVTAEGQFADEKAVHVNSQFRF